MIVFSAFDGIGTGYYALRQAGIPVQTYFASEIDKDAINVAKSNYQDIIQVGNINGVKGSNYPQIDLLMGGSPCQGFSYAGSLLNFDDPRSALFFQFVRLLEEMQPKYFLLENVKMRPEWQDIISDKVGVQPIEINSRLVSGQNRKRLYWTNIPNVTVPADTGVSFSDRILGYPCSMRGRRLNPDTGKRDDYNYEIPTQQYVECRADDKSNCLTTVDKDNVVCISWYKRTLAEEVRYRYLTAQEYEWLQTLPTNYTEAHGLSQSKRKQLLGNAWTAEVIVHILRYLT